MLSNFIQTKEGKINLYYIMVQGLYWMILCCTISMGSAYLANRGYSTIGIGALFALSYLVSTVLQQVLSAYVDSSIKVNVVDILTILGGLLTVILILETATKEKGTATSFTFFAAATIIMLMQPFLNALIFYIEKHGIEMNYGVARASGSFFFFIMSLLVGNLMSVTSERVVPFLGLITSIGFTVTMVYIYISLKDLKINNSNDFDPFENSPEDFLNISYIKLFIAKYRSFFLFLIGLVLFYFGHVLINNFIYQIAANVGGNESDTGGLLALQAIVELPALIFFTKLKDIFGTKSLLAFSAIFYFVKILVTTLASSVGMLYFSMIFQGFAFAIFIPASVHFVDEIMNKKDAVKGQAFVTMAMTLSNLLASIFGGFLIRFTGVKATLWFGTICTICGVTVALFALLKNSKNN